MTENKVLSLLKNQLMQVNSSLKENDFTPIDMIEEHPDSAKFYLKNLTDNLYKGKTHDKLDHRANAIKSSAAMIYNTLGDDSFYINRKKYNQIKYEEKLDAIKTTNNTIDKAHLDARFISDDGKEIVFVESKMLEWFSAPRNLSKVFLDRTKYLPDTGNAKDVFIEFFNSLLLNPPKKDSKGCFIGKFRKYDAIQMTIHILGIYNFYKSSGCTFDKIRLLNIVWDNNNCSQYKKESEQVKDYITLVNEKLVQLFDGKFEIEYQPYSSFYQSISFDDNDRKEYLKRYIIVS